MERTVQIDAYGLIVLTNKAKAKFKQYCYDTHKFQLSRTLIPHEFTTKKILGYEYKVKTLAPLTYEQMIAQAVSGNTDFVCPMYNIIVDYNDAAKRTRLSKLKVLFTIPFSEYKKIVDIAEYKNY